MSLYQATCYLLCFMELWDIMLRGFLGAGSVETGEWNWNTLKFVVCPVNRGWQWSL